MTLSRFYPLGTPGQPWGRAEVQQWRARLAKLHLPASTAGEADRLAPVLGHGLTALVEITLERQGAEWLDAFEARVLPVTQVQQCYRVSPGPDFMLVVHCHDMPDYLALAQRLFTSDANVRNIKAFFSLKRAKFDPRLALPLKPSP